MRESNAESIAGVWIPAFAGMTPHSLTVAFGCGFAARLPGSLYVPRPAHHGGGVDQKFLMRRQTICTMISEFAMIHAAANSYRFWFRYYYFSP